MQQAPPASSRPEDRKTEFVAVSGGRDSTSAEVLLVSAYAIMWIFLLVFLWLGWRRQSLLRDKLERLENALSGSKKSKAEAD
jgi:hypothetical protein